MKGRIIISLLPHLRTILSNTKDPPRVPTSQVSYQRTRCPVPHLLRSIQIIPTRSFLARTLTVQS